MPKSKSVGESPPLTGLEVGDIKAYTYFLTIQLKGAYASGKVEHAELTLDYTDLPHRFERADSNNSRKSVTGPVVIEMRG